MYKNLLFYTPKVSPVGSLSPLAPTFSSLVCRLLTLPNRRADFRPSSLHVLIIPFCSAANRLRPHAHLILYQVIGSTGEKASKTPLHAYFLSNRTRFFSLHTMSDDDLQFNVTKLATDGSNWVAYRDRMIWAINLRQWSEHLTRATVPPSYFTAGIINGLTPDQRWEAEEASAKHLIAMSVPDDVFNCIKTKPKAMEVWRAVETFYLSRTKYIRVDLDKKLQNTKLDSEGDVRAHFMSLTDLREQLSSMGKHYDEDEFAAILLGSLPSSYESTISAMNAVAYQINADITPDQVIRLVTSEFDRRQIMKGQNNVDERKRDGRRNVECLNCHRRGHFKSDCWAKGGDKERQRPPRRNDITDNPGRNDNANTTTADIEEWTAIKEIDEDRHPQAAYSTDHIPRQPEVEIELYSSGATRHMSPFCHRFTNYRTIPPRAITAANNRVFYAIGTGDLQIDVPNGSATTPILLRDTLHAPEMTLTIISISRITRAGNSVTFKDKSCEIKNMSGKVIGTIPATSNGLYKVEHKHSAASAKSVEHVDIR